MANTPGSTLLRRLKKVILFRYQQKILCNELSWSVSLIPVGMSLRYFKLVGFIYLSVRRRKEVSNRSTLLTYHLRRRDDLSAWSSTFILVTKMDILFGYQTERFSGICGGSVSLRYYQYVATMSQRCRFHLGISCDVSVAFLSQVSLTYVSTGTSLQRLKLYSFIYVPMRRRKDVSNRSVSLTYQLRCHNNVSEWSATSRLM